MLAPACGDAPPLVPPERAFTVAPSEALRPAVEHWAERWSAATGVRIEIGAGPVIELAEWIEHPSGKSAAGFTTDARDHAYVWTGSEDWLSTVGHELSHLLGGDHTGSHGILYQQRVGRRDVIDSEALASVCTRLVCPAFNPED